LDIKVANVKEILDQKLVNFDQVIEYAVKKAIEENCGNKG